ncbi:MAG: heavy metal transporter [Flavobacteriaceae bacterium]|nr:heavy metal transporter [Flavobacteriaceae bacterium]|tara:strand:- start:2310 stop:2576 length:267 start_codon:yes stop_codon:yes gene_type:complete
MNTTVTIENLKCGGCAATIKKGLLAIDEVTEIDVNVETSEVQFTSNKDVTETVREKLSKMGYPIAGEKNTLGHKAKSFVSCAIGRMDS